MQRHGSSQGEGVAGRKELLVALFLWCIPFLCLLLRRNRILLCASLRKEALPLVAAGDRLSALPPRVRHEATHKHCAADVRVQYHRR